MKVERFAVGTIEAFAWIVLLIGIGGMVNSALSLMSDPAAPIHFWLFLLSGILGWALLTVIAAVAKRWLGIS